MVAKGSPDPPDNFHNNLTPPVGSIEIHNQMSDSDDDNVLDVASYEGYAPLPIAPNDDRDMIIPYNNSVLDSDSSDDEEDADEANPEVMHIPEEAYNTPSSIPHIESVQREVCRELWAGKFEATNIEMNSEKAQQVIHAMANISLPPSSIPEWAKNLSEDEWKQEVIGRISKLRDGVQDS